MRLSNSLFVQNNMANNTQNNKLAKNIPHFAGEQSQCATTPPGLTRAYAGVKPLRFGVELMEIRAFLRTNKKDPYKSPSYEQIKKVITNDRDAICVWMHSFKSKKSRLINQVALKTANLHESTLEVAKNAIIKAKSRRVNPEGYNAVEDKLVPDLRKALGLPSLPSQASTVSRSHFSRFESAPAQFVPQAFAPSRPHPVTALGDPSRVAEEMWNESKKEEDKLVGTLNQEKPLTNEQRNFLGGHLDSQISGLDHLERIHSSENEYKADHKLLIEAILRKLDGSSLGQVQYADNGHYSYVKSSKRQRTN